MADVLEAAKIVSLRCVASLRLLPAAGLDRGCRWSDEHFSEALYRSPLTNTPSISQTWQRQRSHLFTSWIHVPLGVCFMLVVVWGLKLAIDQAPFRFPAAVLAAFGLFGLLLLLDWLSLRFPGAQAAPDPETAIDEKKGQAQQQRKVRKRFLDPVMALMAPPCDFCLRVSMACCHGLAGTMGCPWMMVDADSVPAACLDRT